MKEPSLILVFGITSLFLGIVVLSLLNSFGSNAANLVDPFIKEKD